MITFFATVIFLVATPGPGVLSLAGVAAGFGVRPAMRYLIGLFLGNNLVGIIFVSGLWALIAAEPRVRIVLLVGSLCYLSYIAFRIAMARSRVGFITRAEPPGIRGGILLQIINPKAYAVSSGIFAGFAFWPDAYLAEVAVKLLIFNAVWIPVHFLWLYLGVWLNRLDLSERAQTGINFLMAGALVAVVVLAAFDQFLAP